MLNALRLFLILLLALTGLSLGAARGQARVAGQVVLCAGESVVVVAVDQQGQPVKQVQVCPDMALSLMQGLHDAPVLPVVTPQFSALVPAYDPPVASGLRAAAARARGPPVFLLS